MIGSIKIANFKAFSELSIDKLWQVTLLSGENNVGKSSLLEAIFLYFGRFNPDIIPKFMRQRNIPGFLLEGKSLFGHFSHNFTVSKPIQIELTTKPSGDEDALLGSGSESLILRYDPQDEKIFRHNRYNLGNKTGVKVDGADGFHGVLGITLEWTNRSGDQVKSKLVHGNNADIYLDPDQPQESRHCVYLSGATTVSPKEDATRFGELDKSNQTDGLLEFIQQFDKSVKGLSLINILDIPVIHADVGLNKKIPIMQLGFGVSRIVTMYLAASAAKDGVLMIDEIDSGIYYKLLPTFWRAVFKLSRKFAVQIIATTHSYECVQAASVDARERISFGDEFGYIRLDRRGVDIIPTYYDAEVLVSAVESGWEVR